MHFDYALTVTFYIINDSTTNEKWQFHTTDVAGFTRPGKAGVVSSK